MKLNSAITFVTTLIPVVFYGPKVVASYGHPSNNGWNKMASNDSQGRLEDIIGQVKLIFQDQSLGKESSIDTQKGNSKTK